MNLEEELVSVPFVQEVQQKLQVVETKLEDTESFCYQVDQARGDRVLLLPGRPS
jgi:hypothetical protein